MNSSTSTHWIDRCAAKGGAPSFALALLLCSAWAFSVVIAPVDSVQGVIQKTLYVHVPCAFAAYLGFVVTGMCGVMYLWKEESAYDRLAHAGAEAGILFCSLVLITGPIWARGTWGKWWSWDPRLSVTVLLWFIYLAYLLLRSFSEGSPRTARFASIYGVVGLPVIVLNYYAIDLFAGRAIHPDNLEEGSLGAGMGLPFLLGVLAILAVFFHLLITRTEVETLRAEELRTHLLSESD
jgi:heme exporter protein C